MKAITTLLIIFFISHNPTILTNEYDNFNTLHIDHNTNFDSLIQHWKSQPNLTAEDHQRINERIKAIQMTQKNKGKCFDYAAIVPVLNLNDPYFLEFSTMYGTELDCQLHKELYQARNTINDLSRRFPDNEYVHQLAPAVHLYAAYAKQEEDPFTAFELADFCHTVTQALLQGINILYDTSLIVGKGVYHGTREFFSLEHWRDLAIGLIHLGALSVITSITDPNTATHELLVPYCFHNTETANELLKKDCLRIKDNFTTLYQRMKNHYDKIKVMPWQDLIQNSTHTSTVTFLQLLTFYAFTNFMYLEEFSITPLKGIAKMPGEGYAIEIEGLKKITVSNPLLIPSKIINVIKNNNILFQRITNIVQNLQSVLPNIKNFIIKRNGTVWNNIKPTDMMYPGTKIPKSFELTVGKQKFWVCPNATDHMRDYITRKIATHNMPINSQVLLTNFKTAVEQAISKGIIWKKEIIIDCWEFRFDVSKKEGLLPTIYHANFKPKGF